MMKLSRSALMAGLVAIGLGACGDDVQVVEPTPPPPPPLTSTMAPASAEVAVGGSVVFAVNASGGAAGAAASWICASSNTGIATASVTSSGCQAMGVAAGGVTITATVTKGSETANVGSRLTVTGAPALPPFEASIAPASATVAVGSSAVFAVNTSGGATGMMGDMMMAASWECSSSDPAIATATTTEAGCEATGVAGGEVTINVAATDGHDTINLVAQLTVSTDPVDPTAPFEATMSPESADVAIESNVVFAINTSGGAADATASWDCTSSDEAIATASTTDAGCQATGIAAGGVTINAAVTKGEDSASLASQLTVTAPQVGDPAFIILASIEDEDAKTTGLKGKVDVQANVERGDQVLEAVTLLVDGDVVASQNFGFAATPALDEPAAQAIHAFTLSFDSGAYDTATGDVDYENGDHEISLQLMVAGSEEPISSNVLTVDFDNGDGVHVTADFPGTSAMNPESGQIWYGGPDAGDFMITVAPVMFSGGAAVESVTLLGVCGADADTKSEAPYTFTLECKESGSVTPKFAVAVGGETLPDLVPLNDDSIFPINLDYEGPEAPLFVTKPNSRQDGWLNAAVKLTGKQGSTNKDGWLTYRDADEGVGGYIPRLRSSDTTPSVVDGALGAAASSSPTLTAATDDNNDICFIATAVDLLGNESSLPKAGKACAGVDAYQMKLDALKVAEKAVADAATPTADQIKTAEDARAAIPAGLRAGVDLTAPTAEFTASAPKAVPAARELKEFQVRVVDEEDGSGMHTDPLLASIEIRTANNKTSCGKADDGLPGNDSLTGECKSDTEGYRFAGALVTTTGVTDDPKTGYYTFSAYARDRAGNKSTGISRVALHDEDDPAPGIIGGNWDKKTSEYSVTVTLTDDFSVRDYYVALDFGTTANLPNPEGVFRVMAADVVDAYNSELTQSRIVTPDISAFRALQSATDGSVDSNASIRMN